MTEQELRILELQAPSTRKCLERSPDLDLSWFRREIPKEAQCLRPDGSVDLNVRECSIAEVLIERKIRYHRGSWLSEMREDEASTQLTEEKKQTAVEAFMRMRPLEWIKNTFKELMKDVKKVDVWK